MVHRKGVGAGGGYAPSADAFAVFPPPRILHCVMRPIEWINNRVAGRAVTHPFNCERNSVINILSNNYAARCQYVSILLLVI